MKYERRGFTALLALIRAVGSGLPVSAAEVKVTSDQTKVTSGSDITLTLTLDEAVDDVICFDYRVYFDEDSFSLKKSTMGTACEDAQISTKPMTYGSEKKPCYSVNFVDTTSEGITIQSGEICQLTFTAKKDMPEDWKNAFQVERKHFATSDYWKTLKDAYVKGKNTFTEEQLEAADVNGDGEVDVTDAILVYGYVNGKVEQFPAENQ